MSNNKYNTINLIVMKNTFYLLFALLSSTAVVKAQFNYVANTANSSTPANQNVLIGPSAGNNAMTGGFNTFLGAEAGKASTAGPFNTFLGYQTGFRNTTGGYNVFLGNQTGSFNTSGSSNLFMGSYAGQNNTTGSYNLLIGNSSGQNTLVGDGNTFIGDGSGYGNTGGSQNTYIGRYAGFTGNSTGSNNTFIGFNAGVSSQALSINNSIAIGSNAQVAQNNSVVLGGTGVNSVSVGIGTTTPQNKLEITSGTANRSGLRLTNLTSSSTDLISLTVSLLNPIVKVLTVDANGDVKLAGLSVNLASGGRQAAGLWESQGSYVQNTSQEGVIIGSGVTKTPSDYNLFVSKGILTEKVKVAVKNTEEWSDYVFAPNYKLKDLTKVDQFIKANKHLPGIPSAQQMVEQGNDLHQTDARLLAKIEELTLYMIDIKKDNQRLRQAYSTIKRQNQRINRKLNITN